MSVVPPLVAQSELLLLGLLNFFPRFFLFDDLCLLFRFSFNLDFSFSAFSDVNLAEALAGGIGLSQSFDSLITALSYFESCESVGGNAASLAYLLSHNSGTSLYYSIVESDKGFDASLVFAVKPVFGYRGTRMTSASFVSLALLLNCLATAFGKGMLY